MSQPDDFAYFQRRAHQERHKAAICDNDGVARIHLSLAEEYDRRVWEAAAAGDQPAPRIMAVRD